MKEFYLILSTIFCTNIGLFSQNILSIGNKTIKAEVVNLPNFNLNGTWKVIYRTYVASESNTYELKPLEELNPEYYRQRKIQGELIYGSYVHFRDTIYIPYCPYLPSIVVNPEYKKHYVNTISNPKDYDPRFKFSQILQVDVLCPLRSDPEMQVEFSVLVFNNDLICILSNNANTFLERVLEIDEINQKWKLENDGFYNVLLIESSDFEIFISNNKASHLIIKYIIEKEAVKYNFIDNLITTNCNNRKTNKIFTTRNIPNIIYPFETKISLLNLYSSIIRINLGTEDQNTKWQVRWKIIEE